MRFHLYLFVFSKILSVLKYFLLGLGRIFVLADRSQFSQFIYHNFAGNFPGVVVQQWLGGSFFNMVANFRRLSGVMLDRVISNSILLYINTNNTISIVLREAKRFGLPVVVVGQEDHLCVANNWKISYYIPVLGNSFINFYFLVMLLRYSLQDLYLTLPCLTAVTVSYFF